MKQIEDLIEISRFYGKDKKYVIAGGGNTSYKNDEKIWIKASGTSLATITKDGFAVLDREKLKVLSEKQYSTDVNEREEEVKNDLAAATLTKDRRPSVETSMHNAIGYDYVVHLHPTLVNALLCANNAEADVKKLFGEDSLYLPYTDPGYILFKKVEAAIQSHREKFGKEPSVIWLQNHGIFVGGNSVDEVRNIYDHIFGKLEQIVAKPSLEETVIDNEGLTEIIPALRMILSGESLKTLKFRNNDVIAAACASEESYKKISKPFIPDQIVYCKSSYLFIESERAEEVLKEAETKISSYLKGNGHLPKIILLKGKGIIAVGDNAKQCDTILDVFEDAIQIAAMSESFGGPHPMTKEQIDFIDNWEVENYRRKVGGSQSKGRVENRTIIVTGAAQGFGEGIAKCLLTEGANIVVADLNETVGGKTAENFEQLTKVNSAIFVKTDVSNTESIENLLLETILNFGGVDCFISNAGVLRAGGLDEMTPENFDFVTKINYSAFFYCTKAVSRIMKLQTKYSNEAYFGDIIQVNSKSGLRGSKANFAYAGGKFGGVGLVQSFALELAQHRIKVNAVCPGNYYEGPLWSDPENGLFVQYLNAGKVPGATTIEEVKNFYLAQVPMKKGCNPEDVTKGVMYLMEQTGETGQALPITGGQVMLA